MTTNELMGLAGGVIVIVGGLLTLYSRIAKAETEIAQMKSDQKVMKDDLLLHSTLNEKAFDRLTSEMNEIKSKLDKLLGYLEGTIKLKL
jgi:hypothetical protein